MGQKKTPGGAPQSEEGGSTGIANVDQEVEVAHLHRQLLTAQRQLDCVMRQQVKPPAVPSFGRSSCRPVLSHPVLSESEKRRRKREAEERSSASRPHHAPPPGQLLFRMVGLLGAIGSSQDEAAERMLEVQAQRSQMQDQVFYFVDWQRSLALPIVAHRNPML